MAAGLRAALFVAFAGLPTPPERPTGRGAGLPTPPERPTEGLVFGAGLPTPPERPTKGPVFGAGLPTPPERPTEGLVFGAGLPTPPERPTEGLPRDSQGLDVPPRVTLSQHAPKQGDLRSSTRAGSGDPRPT